MCARSGTEVKCHCHRTAQHFTVLLNNSRHITRAHVCLGLWFSYHIDTVRETHRATRSKQSKALEKHQGSHACKSSACS